MDAINLVMESNDVDICWKFYYYKDGKPTNQVVTVNSLMEPLIKEINEKLDQAEKQYKQQCER